MSLDAPILSRQKIIAFAPETTTGTPIALQGSNGAYVNAFDAKLNYDIKPTERRGQGSLSRLNPVPGARSGKFTFSSELFGSGTAATAPGYSSLLLACGMQLTSAVYTPLTGGTSTLTMGIYQGAGTAARFKSIVGSVGDLTIKGSTGAPVMLDWSFMGVHVAPTTVTDIAPTYPTTIPPRCAGGAITIGGTAYRVGAFEIAFGNKIALRKDISQVSGYHSGYIVDRNITLKLSPEALPLTSEDWYAAHLAGTTLAFSMTVGGTAGNEFTIAAPVLQLLNPPQDEDDDDILKDGLQFQCVRNSAAGDDELSITCV
jgi:hypothetical protein